MSSEPHRSPPLIPIIIVTGFLGAGKTTLINHLLSGKDDMKFAVIVNEFGDIGIDGALIDNGDEELIELSSGCICCVVRGDLIRTMRRLLSDGQSWDGIVIETTGVANPGPVIQTFLVDQFIAAQCAVQSVTCVVDAAHVMDQTAQHKDAVDQILFADHIILNKTDVASAPPEVIEAHLRALNPFAQITRAERSAVPPGQLLNRHGFALSNVADQLADVVPTDAGHHHHHDGWVGSVSLTSDTPLDQTKFETWLQDLLLVNGTDILRTKAILHVAGHSEKFILQAVNMMVEGDFAGPWDPQVPPISKIVFIGRNLDAAALRRGFESCQATPIA